jgi:hypothetical protein
VGSYGQKLGVTKSYSDEIVKILKNMLKGKPSSTVYNSFYKSSPSRVTEERVPILTDRIWQG